MWGIDAHCPEKAKSSYLLAHAPPSMHRYALSCPSVRPPMHKLREIDAHGTCAFLNTFLLGHTVHGNLWLLDSQSSLHLTSVYVTCIFVRGCLITYPYFPLPLPPYPGGKQLLRDFLWVPPNSSNLLNKRKLKNKEESTGKKSSPDLLLITARLFPIRSLRTTREAGN